MGLGDLGGWTEAGTRLLTTDLHSTSKHGDFGDWVNGVMRWLNRDFPGSGFSAEWAAMPHSELLTGDVYYDNPEDHRAFSKAVRECLSWLSKLPTKLESPPLDTPSISAQNVSNPRSARILEPTGVFETATNTYAPVRTI